METHFYTRIVCACILISICSGTCTFPTSLRGNWITSDTAQGDLVFADTSFSGYKVHTFGTFNFTCELSSGTQYVSKSESFNYYGLQFNAYVCFDLTQVANVSTGDLYTYYKASDVAAVLSVTDQLAQAGNERVLIWLDSVPLTAVSEICTVSDTSTLEYSLLMKNDTLDNVKTTCPIPFLGNFNYTYDTGSGDLCSGNESSLVVCDDKSTMTFNYSQCSQIQAYSLGGVVSCIYSTNSSTGEYTVHVYNQDATTDESTTYRFTCYKVSGYGEVYATQYPGDCVSGQNSTYVASPGGTLVLNSSLLCAYDDVVEVVEDEDSAVEVLSAGAIVAIVIGCLLLIAAVIVAIIFWYYKKRKEQKERERFQALEQAKVDPDDLSPNMRLGLPNESKYDLDRLMYSPDPIKNGVLKHGKKNGELVPIEGLEGYHAGDYMDEDQRQTALEAHMFTEKRKRKDGKDEFKAADPKNKQAQARLKETAKKRKKVVGGPAIGKIKFKTRKAKGSPGVPKVDDDMDGGRGTTAKDIVIQVEEAEGDNKRKTRFAENLVTDSQQANHSRARRRSKTTLDDVETLSDIPDNDMAVDDLESNEGDTEPRLILPNLKPEEKKQKRKRPKDRFSLGSNRQISAMPRNTRFMPPKSKLKGQTDVEEPEPTPMIRTNPNLQSLSPLARIHRKEHPKLWAEAFGNNANMDSCDMDTLKRRLPENKYKRLLEELYADKKYLDYVQKTKTKSEGEVFSSADDGLQYLYGRAMFWEQQEPIPSRPSSTLKRMFSRHDARPSSVLKRSATTTATRIRQVPRTPSTQVSKMKQRDKQAKDQANSSAKQAAAIKEIPLDHEKGTEPYKAGSTRTTPLPRPSMSPELVTNNADDGDDMNSVYPHSTPAPLSKEVTRSDIKLEEFDLEMDFNHQTFGGEDDFQEDNTAMAV